MAGGLKFIGDKLCEILENTMTQMSQMLSRLADRTIDISGNRHLSRRQVWQTKESAAQMEDIVTSENKMIQSRQPGVRRVGRFEARIDPAVGAIRKCAAEGNRWMHCEAVDGPATDCHWSMCM